MLMYDVAINSPHTGSYLRALFLGVIIMEMLTFCSKIGFFIHFIITACIYAC